MGISRSCFRLLCKLKSENGFGESVLQLGRQSAMFNLKTLKKSAIRHGLNPLAFEKSKNWDIYKNIATDKEIFLQLGFKNIRSIDISPYENSDIIHDLNNPVPNSLYNSQDLIFDGGTTEHVFDTLKVLANLHTMLKNNGIIIHYTPANNHVNHGFYQFSPSFYMDYYRENNYEIVESFLVRSFKALNRTNLVYQYDSVIFENLAFGGWGRAMLGNWFVVKKNSNSTSGKIPQQNRYERIFWRNTEETSSYNNNFRSKIVLHLQKLPKIRYFLIQIRRILKTIWFVNRPNILPKPYFRI